MESGRRSIWAVFILVSFASFVLMYAFFSRNFQVEYVAHYSNRSLSWFYTVAAFWAGQAGSLLFWAWLLTLFSVIVLVQNQKRNVELLPYTMGVMGLTSFFFLFLVVFKSNPLMLTPFVPQDGTGLNPLLQNIMMVFHPPSLYVGFVGFTVPFAFAIAALLTKRLDEQWIKSIRRWTLFSWLFLAIGNILGMQWAYVELGWGGYWGWDPVENSSLLPWLTGTAFLHSVIVQERKNMLKIWNISLVALTFALTIFGTFVTRSGLISSVHAFGVSDLGPLFLGFLALIIVGSIVLLWKRSSLLKSEKKLGTWTSKESSFMLNNLLFVALTAGVFLGTILPTISEAIKGNKMTVGADFFNRMAAPIGIGIFLLIGICTLLSWGKTSTKKLLSNFMVPGIVTAIIIFLLAIFGITHLGAMVAFAIAVFAIVTVTLDYIKGIKVRKANSGLSLLGSIKSLTMRNQRRYGGHIVHIGVLLLFVGIIGSSAFVTEKSQTVHVGQNIDIGQYSLTYQGIEHRDEGDLHIDAAVFDVKKAGRSLGRLEAQKHLHANFQPATEVGIRSTLVEDLYVILSQYDTKSGLATISVLINPLVIWMWIGGIIMVLGTVIAIWPVKKSV
jgi:cytochrome c-type biogenesis protein CcmF